MMSALERQMAVERRRLAAGQCPKCGGAHAGPARLCAPCTVKMRGYRRQWRERQMAAGRCVRCQNPARPQRQTCMACTPSKATAPKPVYVPPPCPCGCGGVVAKGNTYATRQCALRGGYAVRTPSQPKAPRASRMEIGRRLRRDVPDVKGLAWWVGLDRSALRAEVEKRQAA